VPSGRIGERALPHYGIRRSRFICLRIEDEEVLDLTSFLSGSLEIEHLPAVLAHTPLCAAAMKLQGPDIQLLAGLNARTYIPVRQLLESRKADAETLARLIDAGLVISDSRLAAHAEKREMEERLAAVGWHPMAMTYHFAAKWGESDPGSDPEDWTDPDDPTANRYDLLARLFGTPPPHFHSTETGKNVNLPAPQRSGDIFRLLGERRSTRLFDERRALSLADLSTLLYHVFGCQGTMRLSRTLTVLKKSSPSGGSLHPTEAYPLALNVEHTQPGFYHYSAERHALERVRAVPLAEAKSLVRDFSADQTFLESAPALIFLISRYDRLFWKYRNHKKAYKVSLMDVGNLTQTCYLVGQELGLGVLFAGAIRDAVLEEYLGLDTAGNGVAGLLACGHPSADGGHLVLQPEPWST
jgi:putative peptide maturation dehydrogenase